MLGRGVSHRLGGDIPLHIEPLRVRGHVGTDST
jgi:hypothetical protein